MYRLINELYIYREAAKDPVLSEMADITRKFETFSNKENTDVVKIKDEIISYCHDVIHKLLDLATENGFNGNLWHNYLAYLLATTETPFTLVCEKVGAVEGSVNAMAKKDLAIFRELFNYNFAPIEEALQLSCFSLIENYKSVEKEERVYNKNVSEKVIELSNAIENENTDEGIYNVVTDFYRNYGVGKFGLNQAFRIDDELAEMGTFGNGVTRTDFLVPITTRGSERLEDLVGYEIQKQELIEATEAFVYGRAANNVLLYGDAGTGKSTSIKAILNRYYKDGLRMIEVYKHEFKYLNRIITAVKNRNYRFVIYMDDLSFEETELEYKYLKAVIEGGLEPKPDNVVIYATSNRRHLVKETWSDRSDRSDDELHRSDTVQEKLSLSARFGVSIGYFKPNPKEYQEIVLSLAHRHTEITLTDQELLQQAQVWEMSHGGISGRIAQQFINYLLGKAES